MGLNNYQPNQNIIVSQIRLGRVSDMIDLECLSQKKVKLPKKRDQLVDLIENVTGEELPLLVLLKMK